MSLKIGLDVDGVLADFNNLYKDWMIEISGEDHFPEGDITPHINTWYYMTDQFGYTKEQDKEVWGKIKNSPNFWKGLEPYKETKEVLENLADLWDAGNDIYFITNRVGIKPKLQTEEWLIKYGDGLLPTVLLSDKKGEACFTLGLDFYIDDKQENCYDVVKKSNTNCLMLARGWNSPIDGVPRIPNVMEFFKAMRESAEWVN